MVVSVMRVIIATSFLLDLFEIYKARTGGQTKKQKQRKEKVNESNSITRKPE